MLRSGWSAFGTEEGGSPLAVDLSAPRIRAARSLVEGVRSGQELGRLLGERFERMLHDRQLDRFIDDVRAAVLRGSGQGDRPRRASSTASSSRGPTRRASSSPAPSRTSATSSSRSSRATAGCAGAVNDLVAELDAVADVLFSQAVHALLRGDAGVAAPTLAATGLRRFRPSCRSTSPTRSAAVG